MDPTDFTARMSMVSRRQRALIIKAARRDVDFVREVIVL
jgi:hypothetical protein